VAIYIYIWLFVPFSMTAPRISYGHGVGEVGGMGAKNGTRVLIKIHSSCCLPHPFLPIKVVKSLLFPSSPILSLIPYYNNPSI
jgi:hypothetical protein